jgi:hypothetical protein
MAIAGINQKGQIRNGNGVYVQQTTAIGSPSRGINNLVVMNIIRVYAAVIDYHLKHAHTAIVLREIVLNARRPFGILNDINQTIVNRMKYWMFPHRLHVLM